MDNKRLPRNKDLKNLSTILRNNATAEENKIWYEFLRTYPVRINRQRIIGNYIVDFYCAKLKLVIEIDGCSHNNKYLYDKIRHEYLESLGLTVLHIDDLDVKTRVTDVLNGIKTFINYHYPALTGTPSPAKGITKH